MGLRLTRENSDLPTTEGLRVPINVWLTTYFQEINT